jgi:hypothetical protein
MIVVFFIIAVVVSMPVAAIVLVSVASRREDRSFSLGRPARGPVQQAARSILDFGTETTDWPRPAGSSRTGSHAGAGARSQARRPRRPAGANSAQLLLATKQPLRASKMDVRPAA